MDDQWNQNPGNPTPSPDPVGGGAPAADPGQGGGQPWTPNPVGGGAPVGTPDPGMPAPTPEPTTPEPTPADPSAPAQGGWTPPAEPSAPVGDDSGTNQGGAV